MQMAMVVISGYVVASSPPAAKLIDGLARLPRNGRAPVGFVAAISMLTSLLNWGLSLVFSGRCWYAHAGAAHHLRMDYRAAGAAASPRAWRDRALGRGRQAAQLQRTRRASKPLLQITGVIPFSQTIFLWQSMLIAVVLIAVSIVLALLSAPSEHKAVTAQAMDVNVEAANSQLPRPERPGEWLEYSPLITLIIVGIGGGWLVHEFSSKDPIVAISNLNTYNLLFLLLGALLHWRPRNFLNAVAKAVPATTGVLIQFPLYGGIATMMTTAKGFGGLTVADQLAHAFVSLTTQNTFPVAMGLYSAVLGFFIPSGGGKWIIEAPYVMQAANDLKVHLGWAVQVYNTAEALPNLINPFWMLPLLGVLGLKARDIVGFTAFPSDRAFADRPCAVVAIGCNAAFYSARHSGVVVDPSLAANSNPPPWSDGSATGMAATSRMMVDGAAQLICATRYSSSPHDGNGHGT